MNQNQKIARHLRKSTTAEEKHFWELVRGRKLKSLKFLRQHPITFLHEGRKRCFVADFYCAKKRLIIEVDGGIHETQKDYDSLRTAICNQLGYQVQRFRNEDLEKPEGIISLLEKTL